MEVRGCYIFVSDQLGLVFLKQSIDHSEVMLLTETD